MWGYTDALLVQIKLLIMSKKECELMYCGYRATTYLLTGGKKKNTYRFYCLLVVSTGK